MWAQRATRVLALSVGLAMMPAAAYAVNVSANDGNGTQHRVASYGDGAKVSGQLKSTVGKSVYYSGKVALGNGCSDPSTGRYTSNTTSTSYVTRGGDITYFPITCSLQGVKSRVCTVRNNFPDPCGPDSKTY